MRVGIFLGAHKILAVVLMSHDNPKHPTAVLLVHSKLMYDTLDGKPEKCLNLALLPIETEANIHNE